MTRLPGCRQSDRAACAPLTGNAKNRCSVGTLPSSHTVRVRPCCRTGRRDRKPGRRCGFLHYPLPTCTCFSDKLSNSYAGFTLDLSTKFISPNQAIVWKACHIVISAHGDRLWRTQVFFWTNFAIAELHELLDLQQETKPSQTSNFKNNSWKPKFKF